MVRSGKKLGLRRARGGLQGVQKEMDGTSPSISFLSDPYSPNQYCQVAFSFSVIDFCAGTGRAPVSVAPAAVAPFGSRAATAGPEPVIVFTGEASAAATLIAPADVAVFSPAGTVAAGDEVLDEPD